MNKAVQIVTSTATREDAEKIAVMLVARQLVACVQISGPIISYFRWQGNLDRAEEWQCTAKTRAELAGAVEQAIHTIHPYDVPEVIVLPIIGGSTDYLRWLHDQTTPEEK